MQLIDANGWNLSWEEVNKRVKDMSYDVLIFRFTPTTFDWDTKIASIGLAMSTLAIFSN